MAANQTNSSGITTMTLESVFGTPGNRKPANIPVVTKMVEDVGKGASVVVGSNGEVGSSNDFKLNKTNKDKVTVLGDLPRSF